MLIDTSTEFGARVEQRLREEEVIWLVTTSADGTPQPSPVWFLWNGETILIHSQPNTPKIANIERNPRVALHFNSDADGDNIVVLLGDATAQRDAGRTAEYPYYVEKYREGMKSIGLTDEQMVESYAAVIRVTPTKVRGH